jgi:hypothetical protein
MLSCGAACAAGVAVARMLVMVKRVRRSVVFKSFFWKVLFILIYSIVFLSGRNRDLPKRALFRVNDCDVVSLNLALNFATVELFFLALIFIAGYVVVKDWRGKA